MYDGSFGSEEMKGINGEDRRTTLGIVLANYKLEFTVVRGCFIAGIICVLAATAVKAWAMFAPPLAVGVTAILVAAASCMLFFALRSQTFVFDRLDNEIKEMQGIIVSRKQEN